jgi:hypothetical protein
MIAMVLCFAVGLKILEKAMAWKKLAGSLPSSNPNAEELSIDDDNDAGVEGGGDVEKQGDSMDASAGEEEEEEESMLGKRKGVF